MSLHPFFSTKVIYAALPKKTFPWKQAFVDQPIIHSPYYVLETFRPFLVKVTGAAESDFGLVLASGQETAAQLDLSCCAKE